MYLSLHTGRFSVHQYNGVKKFAKWILNKDENAHIRNSHETKRMNLGFFFNFFYLYIFQAIKIVLWK